MANTTTLKVQENNYASLVALNDILNTPASLIKNFKKEDRDAYRQRSAQARGAVEKLNLKDIQVLAEYKMIDLDNDGVVEIDGITCKSASAIAEALDISKQDYSRYCNMMKMPIAYDDNYSHWKVYWFTLVWDIVKEADKLPNKFDWSMITPDMNANDIKALHKRLKAIDGTGTGDSTGDNTGDNTGTGTGTDGKKEIPVEPISYDEKLKTWRFRSCTATQYLAWANKHITHRDADGEPVLIIGNISIDYEKQKQKEKAEKTKSKK